MHYFISSRWAVSEGGYEVKGRGNREIVRERRVAPYRDYEPATADGLFRSLSEITNGEQVVKFASEYGLLGLPLLKSPPNRKHPKPVARAELLSDWLAEAEHLRLAMRVWELCHHPPISDEAYLYLIPALWLVSGQLRGGPPFTLPPCAVEAMPLVHLLKKHSKPTREPLHDSQEERASVTIDSLLAAINLKLECLPVDAVLTANEDRPLGRFGLRATSLLSAIWLQFAQAVSHTKQLRKCEWCGRLIEIGWSPDPTVHGKRTNQVTCSRSCRTQLWRERKRDRERKKQAGS